MNDETKQSLAEQFVENTGRALLDSGDAYGRGWQRKAGMTVADFEAQPKAYVQHDYVVLSTFHWLADRVSYLKELDDTFIQFSRQPIRDNDPWLVCAEDFAQKMLELHGDDGDGVSVINTYNHDGILDETLQWVMFHPEGWSPMILLQTHNGCDVRGGYSRPRIYTLDGMEGEYVLYHEGFTIDCDGFKEVETQAEVLEGMPEREKSSHWIDYRNGEWSDEDSNHYTGEEFEELYLIEDGEIHCKTHDRDCDVYALEG
jgi:hypothetical protein